MRQDEGKARAAIMLSLQEAVSKFNARANALTGGGR
jgi:hypothetical protein